MDQPSFSVWTRSEAVANLKRLSEGGAGATPAIYDAIVVGGGIVGVGAARDLAIRGIKTLLVDKGDFASGTSSKSSKLIHGGLRYLEMFEFGLVFESLAERHWLLQTHPHLVAPLEFVLPSYNAAEAPPKARSTGLLGVGLWLYDALSLFRTPFFHGWYDRTRMVGKFPKIRTNGLKGGYYYADAMMLDDELVLECALDARRRGAELLNYMAVTHVSERKQTPWGDLYTVTLTDTLSKDPTPIKVLAREVITCVGPWTEKFGGLVVGGAKKKLRPSKGVHLIVPYKRFPVDSCLVMYAPDGRIVFAIPRKDLGEGAEMVIIGTTDSLEQRDPGEVRANRADVDYLLQVVAEYFPDAKLSVSDLVGSFAGVRPLIEDGAESEAKTSREHEIWRNDTGVVFVAGGKYTTFRPMSQEIVDFAFPDSHNTPEGRSADAVSKTPLSSLADYQARLQGRRLWGRFTDQWLKFKLEHHSPCTFEDVVFRRLPLWMGGSSVTDSVLRDVLALCRVHFKWSEDEAESQLARVQQKLREGVEFR